MDGPDAPVTRGERLSFEFDAGPDAFPRVVGLEVEGGPTDGPFVEWTGFDVEATPTGFATEVPQDLPDGLYRLRPVFDDISTTCTGPRHCSVTVAPRDWWDADVWVDVE